MNLSVAKVLDRVVGGLVGRILGSVDRIRDVVAPRPRVDTVRHILLVKFWGLGNWALLRPIVRDLRARWPGARVTIVTLAGNAPLAEDLADRLLVVRTGGYGRLLRDLLAAVGTLRRDPPDLALDFEQFARAGALLARMAGARQRLGFATGESGRDGLYTVLVPFADDAHAARSFRDLAEAAGVDPAPYRPGHLRATSIGRAERGSLVASDVPYVVLHPGSGDNFPGRRWSEAGFAAAGRKAAELGFRVLVTGGASEAALAHRVAEAIGADAQVTAGCLSVAGLVAVLADASVLVSNDTGPVHVASALGTPVLAVFGPNTPVLYAPLSAGSRSFYRALPCSPCLRTSNYRSSRCRIHTCMQAVSAGEVCTALQRVLRSTPTKEVPWTGSGA